MPLDLVAEIARRLDVDENDLEPVLETVVQRIRQQVTHYGYARLAGLGTFRGRNGHIVFEPDAVLAETVNLRFAGLEPIRVDAPAAEAQERVVAPTPATRWDETELPEEHTLSEFEEEEIAAEEKDAVAEEKDVAVEDKDAVAEDEESTAEEAATAQQESIGAEEPEVEEELWRDQEEEDDHPLGPVPAPAYQDAEFSLVEDQDDDVGPLPELDFDEEEDDDKPESEDEPESEEKRADLESASMWAALGAATGEEEDVVSDEEEPARYSEKREPIGEEPVDKSNGATAEAEDEELVTSETETSETAPTARKHGPDRDALHHEHAQRVWPSEHSPSALDREASRRNTILIGAGVIVLVAAAAIAYFSLQPVDPMGTEPTAQTETQQPADTDSPAGAATDETQAETQEAPAEPTPAAPEPAPAEESTPLRSQEGIDVDAGGFTIVVFSETDQGSATDVVQEYRDEGFRSGVLSSQEGGVTRYRVAIGQFETLEAAVDARNQLAGNELPQDAWVHRFD